MNARTPAKGLRGKRPIAVALLAPLLLSGMVARPAMATADPVPTGPALAAKIISGAARIHQLTEQLDQARRQINTSAAQLATAGRQHDQTMADLQSAQAVLHVQAVTVYMHGPSAYRASASASVDLTVGREYLRVATGSLTETTDRLRVLANNLRRSQTALRAAQQASLDAVAQAEHARDQAILIAGQEQAQLDRIQLQAAAAQVVRASQPISAPRAPAAPATQGLPVNNGLVAVVKAVAAVPVVSVAPTVHVTVTTPVIGGGVGGVWLALRQCESGNNYAANTGNGYFGAYQFSQATWSGMGFPGEPDQEPPAMQDQAAAQLQARAGWGQWPACAAALGLI